MKLLLDTNVFLEILLDQASSAEAQRLVAAVDRNEFWMSDYTLHSIGLLLLRRGLSEAFRQFLADTVLARL